MAALVGALGDDTERGEDAGQQARKNLNEGLEKCGEQYFGKAEHGFSPFLLRPRRFVSRPPEPPIVA